MATTNKQVLTCNEDKNRGGCDVRGTGLPAAAHTRDEGHADKEEANDEHRDHCTRHV